MKIVVETHTRGGRPRETAEDEERIHHQLRVRAALERRDMSDIVIDALTCYLATPVNGNGHQAQKGKR